MVFHAWQESFFPVCVPISYVDDWQLLCPHGSLVAGSIATLERFVQAVDIQLDMRKTYVWSLTADGRKELREQGFSVVLASKNLGAHVQVARKHTNFALTARIQSMSDLWPRLRLSPAGYRTKLQAILVAAWPRALHGVAAVTISDASFHVLIGLVLSEGYGRMELVTTLGFTLALWRIRCWIHNFGLSSRLCDVCVIVVTQNMSLPCFPSL